MDDAQIVVQLRQFARALLADRTLGDELLRLTLLRMPAATARTASRSAVFRSFIMTWRDLRNADDGRPFSDQSLSASLAPPPPDDRIVLILVDAMGFDVSEAAEAIGRPHGDTIALLEEGRCWLASPRVGTALIIEDEPLIAAELRAIVGGIGMEALGPARSARQAVELAAAAHPDVLVADFHLEGVATGIDAVREIRDELDAPVVFITGFPERVLEGADVEPDFVIAKPYTVRSVRAAVAHCLATARPPVAE